MSFRRSCELLMALLPAALVPLAARVQGQVTHVAVEWETIVEHPGYHSGESIGELSEGGYIASGFTWVDGGSPRDPMLVRLDPSGRPVWLLAIESPGDQVLRDVAQIPDGFVAVGFEAEVQYAPPSPYIANVGDDGTLGWVGINWTDALFEENEAGAFHAVKVSHDGEIIAVGYTGTYGGGGNDAKVYIVGIDLAGNVIRAKEYSPGEGPVVGYGLWVTQERGLIVTGSWVPNDRDSHASLFHLDVDWNPIWARSYQWQSSYYNHGYAVAAVEDGFLIVGGTIPFPDSTAGIYLIRTDANGDLSWHKTLPGPNNAVISGFAHSRRGGYVLGTGLSEHQVATRINAEGEVVSSIEFGPLYGQFREAIESEDAGFVLVGWSGSEVRRKMAFMRIGPELPFLRGDSNQDGDLDISDALFLLNWLFSGEGRPQCADAADMNDDGELDISDAIYFLEYQFSGGTPLPDPLTAEGMDPTPDLIGCIGHNRERPHP